MLAPVSVPDRQAELARDLQEACHTWDILLDKLNAVLQARDMALANGSNTEAAALSAEASSLRAAADRAKRRALTIAQQLATITKQKTA